MTMNLKTTEGAVKFFGATNLGVTLPRVKAPKVRRVKAAAKEVAA